MDIKTQPYKMPDDHSSQARVEPWTVAFQNAAYLLFIIDRSGRILDTLSTEHHLNFLTASLDQADLVGFPIQQALPPEAVVAVAEAMLKKTDDQTNVEYVRETPSGLLRFKVQCTSLDQDRLLLVIREIGVAATSRAGRSAPHASLHDILKDQNILALAEQITATCGEQFGAAKVWLGIPEFDQKINWLTSWPDGTAQAEFTTWQTAYLLQNHSELVFDKIDGENMYAGGLFPLIAQGTMVGVLGVLSAQEQVFNDHLEQLRQYTKFAAMGLYHALLYVEAQHRVEQIQALRTIDNAILSSFNIRETAGVILEKILQQLNVDAADILMLDKSTQSLHYVKGLGFRSNMLQYTHLQLGQSYAGLAALEKRIVHIENLDENPKNFVKASNFDKEAFHVYLGTPLIVRGEVKGVLEIFQRGRLDVDPDWYQLLEMIANQVAIAIDNSSLLESLDRRNKELTTANNAIIEGLSRSLELRDRETEGHTRRVAGLTIKLAEKIGINGEQLEHMKHGALLHDLGKMGIPDEILHKPGSLTPQEWEVMKHHPQYAYNILSQIDFLKPALEIPLHHHERWDGSGYPHGLKGDNIPLGARIFAVIDVYDALTTDRPYRSAWSKEQTLAYIASKADVDFDPLIVKVFIGMADEL